MIDIKTTSVRELREQLAEAAARGRDPQPIMREIADDLREAQASFLRNPRWAAQLSPEYAAQKARKGRGTKTGVVTGAMLRSLTSEGSPEHYERVTPEGVEIGSRNKNAIRFNQGAYRKTPNGAANRQPRRKLYKLKVRDRKLVMARVIEYLTEPFDS